MVSILIPAYQTQDYIEECLDSIQNQKGVEDLKYEIVVGVDNCKKTLDKVMEIKEKYDNLKVLHMRENYGLFITLNTLLGLAEYENIVKFDSDDIMLPTLLQDVMSTNGDLIRFKFFLYYGKDKPMKSFHAQANGVYFIKKKVYDIFGGYQPWKCGADTEFLYRLRQHGKMSEVLINKELFLYRQHNNSLSKKIPFTNNSLRKKYHAMYRGKIYTEFRVEPVIGEYDVVYENTK